jgi:hypothetical protein
MHFRRAALDRCEISARSSRGHRAPSLWAPVVEALAEATKAAQRAGIAHAKANDDNPYRGRKPS